jgi:CRP/FNR family cyclic AMP-dependent transcriptional regulator
MNAADLKQIPALQSVEGDALTRLAAALEEKNFSEGERVFSEGDAADAMYFVHEGSVRIEKRASASADAVKTLAVLTSGDYFGEMALFDQKPRSASAVAQGATTLLRLSKPTFDQLCTNSVAGMSVLAAMIRTSSERIRRLSAEVIVYDEIGKAIGASHDLQTLCDVILRQLATASLADWGLFLGSCQFSGQLELRSSLNLTLTPAQHDAIREARGFLGIVQKQSRDLLIEDFDRDETFKPSERLGFETPSLLIAPVIAGGEFLGLIILGGHDKGQLRPNDLNLARGVASQAGQAVLNARHHEEDQARSRHARQFVRF